ncbi:MAG: endonuclease domain-containing protein [Oscillospiraceae bacterium]|nr:endonuclease domain-containing protein [Oscillospiraceae bacterium]
MRHKHLARELRSQSTKEENKLWYDFLSRYPVRFLRQRPIGRYIADFYCPSCKLVIEIDGKQHEQENAIEYDRIRTEFFNAMGISVVRFTNDDINTRFNHVCETIKTHIPRLSS